MSIWAALAGGSKKYLQDKEQEQLSEQEMRRWQEKQNFLNKLTMEAEERQQKYNIEEEGRKRADKMLDEESRLLEKRRDQEREDKRFSVTDARANRQLDITDRNTSIAAEANKINRDSLVASREEGLALRKRQEADNLQRQAYQVSFTKDEEGQEIPIHPMANNLFTDANLDYSEAIAQGDYDRAANIWREYIASLRRAMTTTNPKVGILQ